MCGVGDVIKNIRKISRIMCVRMRRLSLRSLMSASGAGNIEFDVLMVCVELSKYRRSFRRAAYIIIISY